MGRCLRKSQISALCYTHFTASNHTQISFDNFVLTNSGEISQDQIKMYREKIRTIGISILGGNSGVQGAYELGIDSIRAVNEEDVTINTNGAL